MELFNITLQANDTEYKASGKTVFEALSNIPLNSLEAKTKGNFIITQGKRKAEKLLYLKQVRMLLWNHLRRAGWAKQFESLLK